MAWYGRKSSITLSKYDLHFQPENIHTILEIYFYSFEDENLMSYLCNISNGSQVVAVNTVILIFKKSTGCINSFHHIVSLVLQIVLHDFYDFIS